MSNHEYTPQAALELLMRKLSERDLALATEVRAVVDQGKDIQESEASSRGRKKKYRVYRKTVPYPYDEALQVAVNALAACFIEQPMFIDSCLKNMARAPLGYLRGFRYPNSPKKSTPVESFPALSCVTRTSKLSCARRPNCRPQLRPSHQFMKCSPSVQFLRIRWPNSFRILAASKHS